MLYLVHRCTTTVVVMYRRSHRAPKGTKFSERVLRLREKKTQGIVSPVMKHADAGPWRRRQRHAKAAENYLVSKHQIVVFNTGDVQMQCRTSISIGLLLFRVCVGGFGFCFGVPLISYSSTSIKCMHTNGDIRPFPLSIKRQPKPKPYHPRSPDQVRLSRIEDCRDSTFFAVISEMHVSRSRIVPSEMGACDMELRGPSTVMLLHGEGVVRRLNVRKNTRPAESAAAEMQRWYAHVLTPNTEAIPQRLHSRFQDWGERRR